LVGREHEFVVAFDTGALFFPICSEPLTPLGGVFLQKQKIGGTSALRTEIAPAQGRSEGMEAGPQRGQSIMGTRIGRALILATGFINIAIATCPGHSTAHERTAVRLRWSDVVARVRYSGFELLTLPVLTGKTYVAEAYRHDGTRVRVFLSAESGDILAIEPAATGIVQSAQNIDRPAGERSGGDDKHRPRPKTAKATTADPRIQARTVACKTDSVAAATNAATVVNTQNSSAAALGGDADSIAKSPDVTVTAKIQEPASPQLDQTNAMATKENTPADAKPAAQISVESTDSPDPIIAKAKTTIAAKMESAMAVVFSDMHRALRKNVLDESIDTICGYVNGKNASGGDIGERPFLYLVKEDEAYIVNGTNDIGALAAYRNICN